MARRLQKAKAIKKRKKTKPAKKRKAVKKVKKSRKPKKVKARKAKKVAKRRPAKKAAPKSRVEKTIGKVVHYYDRIGVAIVELTAALSRGDAVRFKHGGKELFQQKVLSMQINHQPIQKAKKGEVVGVKVDKEAREGTRMLTL